MQIEDKVEKAFKESRIEEAFTAGSPKTKTLALVRVLIYALLS